MSDKIKLDLILDELKSLKNEQEKTNKILNNFIEDFFKTLDYEDKVNAIFNFLEQSKNKKINN